MERNYDNRDFEQFLKQNADQYRMFPSENVWKGIDKALHTRRKWYGLGLALLLLLTGAGVTLVMITTPVKKEHTELKAAPGVAAKENKNPASEQEEQVRLQARNQNGPVEFNAPLQNTPRSNAPFIAVIPDQSVLYQEPQLQPATTPVAEETKAVPDALLAAQQEKPVVSQLLNPEQSLVLPLDLSTILTPEAGPETDDTEASASTGKAVMTSVKEDQHLYPMTIESVLNSYKRKSPRKSVSFQVYFSPTVSYRKLSENKAFLRSAASSGTVPATVAYKDVNNAVKHKPDLGLELGGAARYPLTKNLLVKAGLQFNISRYDISAFYNPGEIATIALDAGAGGNTISQETIYRNEKSSRTNWLQNLYYSASIPVGAELRFPSRNSTYFAIAGTVQPTYIISDRAYLLSTDYKNYVEIPSLIRRWNLNTGFEAMIGYTSGTTRWEIGPQVRYQVLSSFVDRYPLKENLFDFGLKVGVTLNR